MNKKRKIEENPAVSFGDLPVAVKGLILGYLTLKEKIRLFQVSSSQRDMVCALTPILYIAAVRTRAT
jgi:hypothetical protein